MIIAAAQMDAKAAYVACSRGRHQAALFTPDKNHLFARVEQSGDRLAASDLQGLTAAARSGIWREQEQLGWQRMVQHALSFQARSQQLARTNELKAPEIRLSSRKPSGPEIEM